MRKISIDLCSPKMLPSLCAVVRLVIFIRTQPTSAHSCKKLTLWPNTYILLIFFSLETVQNEGGN